MADSDRILQFLDDVHSSSSGENKAKFVGAPGAPFSNGKSAAASFTPYFPLKVDKVVNPASVADPDAGPASFYQCKQSYRSATELGLTPRGLRAKGLSEADLSDLGLSADRARALNLLFSKQLNAYVLYFSWVSPEGYKRTMQAKGVEYVPWIIPFKRSIIDYATRSTRESF